MNKILSLLALLTFCVVLAQNVHAQATGNDLLEKYSDYKPVKPEDNKIGLSIAEISKGEGNSFFIQWKSSSDLITKNPRGHQLVAVFLYFIDADDHDNMKIGFASQFKGNIGELDKMIVTLGKPAKRLIIYFEGVGPEIKGSEEIRTSPLFFMATLGEKPKLLEQTPRYAGDLFKQAVKDKKDKEK